MVPFSTLHDAGAFSGNRAWLALAVESVIVRTCDYRVSAGG